MKITRGQTWDFNKEDNTKKPADIKLIIPAGLRKQMIAMQSSKLFLQLLVIYIFYILTKSIF